MSQPSTQEVRQLCVAFDLDDTLYLEREYVRSGCAAVGKWMAENVGVNGFGDHVWRLFESGQHMSMFQSALADFGRPADREFIGRLLAVYREHRPRISLLQDAVESLLALREHAILGIITDGTPERQRAKCESLGVDKLVDFIICTGYWAKPHPHSFKLMQLLAEPAREFVYVGDNPLKDFGAPLSLGWETIRVRRQSGLYFHLESCPGTEPRLVVPNLSGLPKILAVLFSPVRHHRNAAAT